MTEKLRHLLCSCGARVQVPRVSTPKFLDGTAVILDLKIKLSFHCQECKRALQSHFKAILYFDELELIELEK
jgi:hypothetical protein